MHISDIYIDGFGLYKGASISGLPNGLVVLLGDNESGKTTLMAFIRFVFFGPSRQRSANAFAPLSGGSPGGRLAVILRDGTSCVLSRTARSATLAVGDGPEQECEPSQRLLGGLDRDTYCSVFSVGLSELQGLDLLDQDAVRARLISAAAGLGTVSLPQALKETDEAISSLLSRSAASAIKGNLRDIRELDRRLDELRSQATTYAAYQKERDELKTSAGCMSQEAERTRERISRLGQLIRARQHWASLCGARQQVRALDALREFPAGGVARLDELRNRLSQAEAQTAERADEAKLLQERITSINSDNVVLSQRDAVERLKSERSALVSALSDISGLADKVCQAEEELAQRLQELGQGWTVEQLSKTDTSVSVKQTVLDFGRRMDSLERDCATAAARLVARQDDVTKAQKSSDDAESAMAEIVRPSEESEAALNRKLDALALLRSALHERDVLKAKREAFDNRLQDLAAASAALGKQREVAPRQPPIWIPVAVAAVGLALVGVLLLMRQWLGAIVLAAVAGILFVWTLASRKQSNARAKTLLSNLEGELSRCEEREQALRTEVANLDDQIGLLDQRAVAAAKTAEVELPGSLSLLEVAVQDVGRRLEEAREWKRAMAEKNKADAVLKEASESLAKATAADEAAGEALGRAKHQWREWLAGNGFDTAVRPQAFEVVLNAVDAARTAQARLKEAEQRRSQVDNYVTHTKARVGSVASTCQKQLASGEPGVDDVDALARALTAAEKAETQLAALRDQLAAAKTSQIRSAQAVEATEREIASLLEAAGAVNEEDFRRRAEQHEEWRGAKEKAERADESLLAIAGTVEERSELERELAAATSQDIDEEAARLKAREAELSGELTEATHRVGGLDSQIRSLENDEKLGELLLERQVLAQKLQGAVKRWTAMVVCKHLLEQARGVYERERQPQVVQDASGYLATMTGGRYSIVCPVGENSVVLEDASRKRKGEIAWSGGLADQAYLSVRLGLAKAFCVGTEPLPVILDEVLVKFDPTRQENVGRLLVEYAKTRQVLLFTCHPEVVDRVLACANAGTTGGVPVACYNISNGQVASNQPQHSAVGNARAASRETGT